MLGDQPGKAPLSDLLVLGFGEAARPVTTVVAVLLSVGAMNAYFAGGARLGAALARDGSLPAWLAHGSHRRRRCRAAPSPWSTVGGLTTLAVITVGDLPLERAAADDHRHLHAGLRVGTAAALRLLPRGTLGAPRRRVSVRRDARPAGPHRHPPARARLLIGGGRAGRGRPQRRRGRAPAAPAPA